MTFEVHGEYTTAEFADVSVSTCPAAEQVFENTPCPAVRNFYRNTPEMFFQISKEY